MQEAPVYLAALIERFLNAHRGADSNEHGPQVADC